MRWNGEGTQHDLRDIDARSAARLHGLTRRLINALAWALTWAAVIYVMVVMVVLTLRAVDWVFAALNFA